MNKQEFFAAVKAYKEGRPPQPKVSRDYTIDDWADQYYDQAVALKAKALLAHSCDRSFDADIYNQQLGILTHMLDGMEEAAELLADIESDAIEVLEHGEWKKHKYIRIENGRYIYPEDDKSSKELTQKLDKAASDSAKAISSGSKDDQVNAHNQYAKIVEGYGLDNKERGNDTRTIENKFGEKVSEKMKENAQKGEGGSYNQAQSSMAGYDEWKKKDSFDRKVDQTKRVIENTKNDMEMKQKVQERDVLQAQKDYEANMDKYAKDTLNSWINQLTKGDSAHYSDPEMDKKLIKTGYSVDKMNTDLAKKLTEEWDQKKQSIDPSTRSKVEWVISNLVNTATGQTLKPKKLGHSFEPLSKDEYYAAIEEYKRKKA